jgi:hypothetical protein
VVVRRGDGIEMADGDGAVAERAATAGGDCPCEGAVGCFVG